MRRKALNKQQSRLIWMAIAFLMAFNMLTWCLILKDDGPGKPIIVSLETGQPPASRYVEETVAAAMVGPSGEGTRPRTRRAPAPKVGASIKTSKAPVGAAIGAAIGVPVSVSIPSIALKASVEKVTLTADGSMAVPKNLHGVGWYAYGPRPGESGTAVIDGHLNGPYGVKAVFANLHHVAPGDRIVVQDDSGQSLSFVVRARREYGAGEDATGIFNAGDDQTHLNLITCDGEWDGQSQQYTKRLVILADREI
jgi:sortase (surface protein transpeptidase)